MRHDKDRYELKFGEATVTLRRIGSSHRVCGRILGQEPIQDSDRVRIWVDRMMFDRSEIEQETWRAYGAISTILEVQAHFLSGTAP